MSIEVGHVRLTPGPVYNNLAVVRSIEIARAVGETLKQGGFGVQYVALVDDKEIPKRRRREAGLVLVGAIEQQLDVAYWFPEHGLKEYRHKLVELLPTEGLRRRVGAEFEERIADQGALPCSADIGIWHGIRLGYIEDTKKLAVTTDSPFRPADIIVSILPEGDAEPEQVARDRYVKYFPCDAQNRVFRLYYPTDPEQPYEAHGAVNKLVYEISSTTTTITEAVS